MIIDNNCLWFIQMLQEVQNKLFSELELQKDNLEKLELKKL